jgi:hypothetical protein
MNLKSLLIFSCTLFLFSCQPSSKDKKSASKSSNEDLNTPDNTNNVSYNAHISFNDHSQYVYSIVNETAIELKVNDKTVDVLHKSDVGLIYDVQKDSAGNFVLNLRYDKIYLFTKNGDNEVELDAAHSAATLDPTERMLGLLKNAKISATINSTGKVLAINGYKELGEKILASFNDENARNMAKAQWEKVVGEGMIKKNIEQLFSVLPDTTKKVGDVWKRNTLQKGEIDMNVSSTFTLKEIDGGIATIESEGEMSSEPGESNVMGYTVTNNFQGNQQGEFEVETQTGMVLKNNTTSRLKGAMQLMGKEVPVTMKTTITMKGKKL